MSRVWLVPVGAVLAVGFAASLARKAVQPRPLPDFRAPLRTWDEASARFVALRAVRPDALSGTADGYSRRFHYYRTEGRALHVAPEGAALGTIQLDEYGRQPQGVANNPLGALLRTAQIALPWIPGVGPAASAALAASIAIAQGKSAKDIALAAARNALPGPARLAFDVGVAVASGERVDATAKDALLAQIPGGAQAYAEGRAAWKLGHS